tara:strand:- start:74 stop:643 length:570 start_codon:yes stop_codon:yes gene_type:complete
MQNVNIIEDFYSPEHYGIMQHFLHTTNMKALYQPNKVYYPNRLQAYPCWETEKFEENMMPYDIFKKTLELKTGFKTKEINSFFRTIKKSELEQSPFLGKDESMVHQDDKGGKIFFAGIVYFNSFSIKDGTRIYSYKDQIEPDIIIGSKPNRCIIYRSDLFHSAGIDWRQDQRTVQVFFFNLEGDSNAQS